MKLVSWNVNGLRACVKKGFLEYFHQVDADIFSIQETKLQEGQIELSIPDYHQYWNYAIKKGYSGTAVFTKIKPIHVTYGLDEEETGDREPEGRILTLEYESFFLVNVYTPNSQRDLARLPFRLDWEDRFFAYIKKLDKLKPVIICGDLNVAHEEIDLKNPKSNKNNSGFTEEERGKMTRMLGTGFTDTFRYFYPDEKERYTWWSYMNKVRERNIGWRIDYFLVSNRLHDFLVSADIDADIHGSDHCPVILELDV
ncbi:exodeoxyribonuclease III [Sutcliffiella rhizosphaerae]|uniref:Exodeoxyribonuclease n=1 Tax=Sutcliffiella rhizosphaerae TaxID=2880967 RepID=A0ABM8YNZ0_9BACI|nr:exodeoxyribonuclease III [Sutcliffiella rhizosphaerae]CAG9621630.1 Exodeoxyribonuclease [Sutcliffiella rhizosphaerae]